MAHIIQASSRSVNCELVKVSCMMMYTRSSTHHDWRRQRKARFEENVTLVWIYRDNFLSKTFSLCIISLILRNCSRD